MEVQISLKIIKVNCKNFTRVEYPDGIYEWYIGSVYSKPNKKITSSPPLVNIGEPYTREFEKQYQDSIKNI